MYTTRLLFTLLSLWNYVCDGQVTGVTSTKPPRFKQFYQELATQFDNIDRLHQSHSIDSYDSLEGENDKILGIIQRYKADLFNFPDSMDYDLVYLTRSEDRKLVLISWDTRMGGTMIDFTTTAVYKTPIGVQVKPLVDTTESMPHTYMHYNTIHTVTNSKGSKIYLAWGSGQGSTIISWQEIRAFSIANGKLVDPFLFPGKESKIFVDFDLNAFDENERVPAIKVRDGGRTILVPLNGTNQGFSGKYKTYLFNGKVFTTK